MVAIRVCVSEHSGTAGWAGLFFLSSLEKVPDTMRNAGVFWRSDAATGIWQWGRLGQATLTGSSAGEVPEDDGTRCDFCFLFPSPQTQSDGEKYGADGA